MTVTSYLQFALALVFVLALIGVAALLARRFGLGHAPRPTGRRRRLAVEEILPLDGKRRLVLIRRDAVEHLLVLGPSSEMLVERGIAHGGAFGAALREQVAAAPFGESQPR
jgi:flagellar protein FliO/FliZ